jgi:hypothetical protein
MALVADPLQVVKKFFATVAARTRLPASRQCLRAIFGAGRGYMDRRDVLVLTQGRHQTWRF